MQLEGKYCMPVDPLMCCLTALRYNLDVHMVTKTLFVGSVLIALQFGNLHQV